MKLLVLFSFLVCASARFIPGHKNNKPGLHFPDSFPSAGVPAPFGKNLKTVYAEVDRSAKTPADTILFELKENFDIPTGNVRYSAPHFVKDHPYFLSPPHHGPIAELPAVAPAPSVAVIPAVAAIVVEVPAAPVAAVPAAPVEKSKCPCKDHETENSKEDAETDDSNDDAPRQSRQSKERRGGVEEESYNILCPCLLGNSGPLI